MTIHPRHAGLCLVGLVVASLVVVTLGTTRVDGRSQDASRGSRPGVGTVRGTLVYGSVRDSGTRPDAGSDIWVFAGKIELPLDCAVFPSFRELTIGECATRNRSLPFLKHAQASGSGSFEVGDLPPGEYTLVIRSAHVGGTEKRDAGNKFAISWFSIKGGDTVDASTKF